MVQKYAKDQHAGFTNRIEKVAIVGAGGSVGKYLTEAMVKTGKHNITVLTRIGSTSKIPEGTTVVPVDYDNEDSLVSALKGQQFLVITMAPRQGHVQTKVINAASKAGVPYIMPNSYAFDIEHTTLVTENHTGRGVQEGIDAIKKAGAAAWITMNCNFWYEPAVAGGPRYFGIDLLNKKMTFYDEGTTRVNTTTWVQCGRALAALLSLKELPQDEHDTTPALTRWCNKQLRVSSFLISQRDMLDSIQRVTGTTDADWTIDSEPSGARYKRGLAQMEKGDYSGWGLSMYARTFYPSDPADFETKKGTDNAVLGLPKEELDEVNKTAVEMAEDGFKYY